MRFAFALVALLIVVPGSAAQVQEPAPERKISRIVTVVRGADEKPVEGAVVEAWRLGKKVSVTRTGADGTARFAGMDRMGVVYVARLPGHLCGWHEPGRWWWHMPEEDLDPDGDGVTRMKLVLVPGTMVTGRVTTKKGEPIEGAVIEARESEHATDIWALRGAPLWTATTDADGRFETKCHWPKLEHEDQRYLSAVVTAGGPGWIHERAEIWPGDAGSQKALLFSLHAAGRIQGVVTDGDDGPVAGAEVHAYPPDHHWFGSRRHRRDTRRTHPREMHVVTNERGEYFFREAFPGVEYRIFTERETGDRTDLRSAVTEGVGVAKAGEKVARHLRVRRLGRLSVRIDPREGGTSNRARIDLQPPPDARPWVYDRKKAGVVTVDEADPGKWTIVADADGWLRTTREVELGEGQSEDVTIRLEPGATIEGIVVDDDGKPVPGATVLGYGVDPENPDAFLGGYEQTTTGPDGTFRLGGLRPGPTALGVNHDELEDDSYARVDAPAKDVRIAIHARGSLSFRLLPTEGTAPPTSVRVTITRADGAQLQWNLTTHDGVFRIMRLMPGPVSFAVEAEGYAPYIRTLTVRPGVANVVEPFAMSKGITFLGRVVDGAGKPVAGARVVAWGNEAAAVVTGEDGSFSIPHMIAGSVDLSVRAEGMAESLVRPKVGQGAEPVSIIVTPGGIVRGVYRYRGDPMGVVSVDIFPAAARNDNVSRWRVPIVDGAFRTRLPPGRYRITGHLTGEKRGPVIFTVEEGGEVVLDIDTP